MSRFLPAFVAGRFSVFPVLIWQSCAWPCTRCSIRRCRRLFSINEAVELTRKYSSEESCSFVNGVLGTISRKLAQQA